MVMADLLSFLGSVATGSQLWLFIWIRLLSSWQCAADTTRTWLTLGEFSPVDYGSVGVILLTFLVQSLFQFCVLAFVATHIFEGGPTFTKFRNRVLKTSFLSDTCHLEGKR